VISAPQGLAPHSLVSYTVTKTTENFNKKFPNDLKNYQNDTQWISGLQIFYHSKFISQPSNIIVGPRHCHRHQGYDSLATTEEIHIKECARASP